MTTCYACKYPGDYDYPSLKWMRENERICPAHIKQLDAMSPETTEKPTLFVPKEVKNPKNYQDREPGEDG